MSELLDRIAIRYEDERLTLEIPEWGADDEPLVAYSRLFTVEEERKVMRSIRGDTDDPQGWARIVFDKLQNAEGARLFNGDDFNRFKRIADAHVCKRIGMQIFTATPSVEDAGGNSDGTPA